MVAVVGVVLVVVGSCCSGWGTSVAVVVRSCRGRWG